MSHRADCTGIIVGPVAPSDRRTIRPMTAGAPATPLSPQLRREVGLFGAIALGLGSIIGTGVFVSIGIAAGIAGPSVVLAILLAALVALCNALSSAQLAAVHPVSGGTYEYAYLRLSPVLGFTAGWMFLCAKTASAATAALGFSGYLLHELGIDPARWHAPVAAAAAIALTCIVLSGLRRSSIMNMAIVVLSVGSLATLIFAASPAAAAGAAQTLHPLFPGAQDARTWTTDLLHAAALMFVAFTGYGRLATLGEEVRDPRRTIPLAILCTLAFSAALYVAVAAVSVGAIGATNLSAAAETGSPLEAVARHATGSWLGRLVAAGAIAAMLGVLLNLILGLSRVLLAMGRRGDMPRAVARLNTAQTSPTVAVMVIGLAITLLAAFGSIKAAWSFSAFTVLIYYAITNLAALRLRPEERLYHPALAWAGLAGCLGLAFWVEPAIWLIGIGLIAAGLVWHTLAQRAGSRAM